MAPLEKISVCFGLSLIVLFFLGFFSFIFGVNPKFSLIATLIFAALLVRKLSISKQEVLILGLFLGVFFLLLSIQTLLPYYTGGLWYFDWYEHYQRSLFFLHQFPLDYIFGGQYALTSRPPFFNVVSSVFLSVFGRDFYVYQIIATGLNSLIILPIILITHLFIKGKKVSVIILAFSLFLLNPAMVQQATFPWTKSLSAFYTLLGLYFYLRGRNVFQPIFLALSGVFFASGYLTHYSVLSYIIFPILDIVTLRIFFKKTFSRILFFALPFLAVILPWFLWASSTYGLYRTFLGNTAYEWQKNLTISQHIQKDITNITYTLLPLISADYKNLIDTQKIPLVRLYDLSLNFYVTTIPGNLTLSLIFVLVLNILKRVKSVILSPSEGSRRKMDIDYLNTSHWLLLYLFISMLISFLVYPISARGMASITLFPAASLLFSLAIFALMKIKEALPRIPRLILVVTMTLEVFLGIGVRVYTSSVILNPDNNPGVFSQVLSVHEDNYRLKKENNLIFLHDRFSGIQPFVILLVLVGYMTSVGLIANSLRSTEKTKIFQFHTQTQNTRKGNITR